MTPADHSAPRHHRHEGGGCPISMREPSAEPVTPWTPNPHRRCNWVHKPIRRPVKRPSR